MESLVLAMRADVGDVATVTNSMQALISAFWMEESIEQTLLQHNSFGRRAIKDRLAGSRHSHSEADDDGGWSPKKMPGVTVEDAR